MTLRVRVIDAVMNILKVKDKLVEAKKYYPYILEVDYKGNILEVKTNITNLSNSDI